MFLLPRKTSGGLNTDPANHKNAFIVYPGPDIRNMLISVTIHFTSENRMLRIL